MKTKLLFLLLIALSIKVGAQNDTLASGRVWDLRQCIDYALKNSLSIKRSEYNVKTYEVDYNQSRWALSPTLNGSVNY